MPRKPRLDCPGLLYHVIARGIERRKIFIGKKDYALFLSRLGEILLATETPLYAFALMPNHVHLLIRRGGMPIGIVMQRLLTGYAVHFNRDYNRTGHLFQNRYKGVICQDDAYLLELVRYIHLNPIRAGLVDSLDHLEGYPYCGHQALVGRAKCEWLSEKAVLAHFGKNAKVARTSYLSFVENGLLMGHRPELSGGGLKRSRTFLDASPQERWAFDERVLGEGSFVEDLLIAEKARPITERRDPQQVLAEACAERKITVTALAGPSKARELVAARILVADKLKREAGLTGAQIARLLNATDSAVSKMLAKARTKRNSTL
ncbi:MAG: transposase [Chloroflexi bacterium]|nr:transposase [Chloroflexota bacterium]